MELDVIKPKLFNGKYTLTHGTRHWTFEIKTQSAQRRFRPEERLISLLSGPDNQGDWRAIGVVDEDGIHLFNKHLGTDLHARSQILWKILVDEDEDLDDYDVIESARCYMCNRELTVPESILTGIGPVCAERMSKRLHKEDPQKALQVKLERAKFLLAHLS